VKKHLSPQQRREIVALSQVDEKTLRRWIRGETLRPTTRERIESAVKKVRGK
jgi:hypothetical protein